MTVDRIEVDPPFSEVRRKLRAAGDEFPKRLQKANKKIAEEVAEETRDRYRLRYKRLSGEGQKSIRPRATQTSASVVMGGPRAPYVPGQNFGSNKVKRFAPKAMPDRFLYTAIEEMKDDIEKQANKAIDDVLREAYPRG